MSVSKAKTGSVAGVVGGYAPLDSGLLVPNSYLDADLAAIAALTTTSFGRGLLALVDPADATKFLNGLGAFSVPTGGLTQPQVMARGLGS